MIWLQVYVCGLRVIERVNEFHQLRSIVCITINRSWDPRFLWIPIMLDYQTCTNDGLSIVGPLYIDCCISTHQTTK